MKKYLFGLFVGLIGLINFGYCDVINGTYSSFNAGTTITVYKGYCYYFYNTSYKFKFYDNNNNYLGTAGSSDNLFCMPVDGYVKNEDTVNSYIYKYNLNSFTGNCSSSSCPTCPEQYTKGECQLQYNLIPVENVDQHYCETNDLCPEQNECTGTGLDWSALFINNIQHQSAPLINISIPEEFNWDYTSDEEEFNLSVEGYNVDTEYIDGIIRTQNYKPTSEDFTQLVGMLAPYSKYLLFLLFVFIIWAWIKKPFKSKKL